MAFPIDVLAQLREQVRILVRARERFHYLLNDFLLPDFLIQLLEDFHGGEDIPERIGIRRAARESLHLLDAEIRQQELLDLLNDGSRFLLENLLLEYVMAHDGEDFHVHVLVRVPALLFENEILVESNRHAEQVRRMEREDKETIEQLNLLLANVRVQEEEQINLLVQIRDALARQTESIREQVRTMEVVQRAQPVKHIVRFLNLVDQVRFAEAFPTNILIQFNQLRILESNQASKQTNHEPIARDK